MARSARMASTTVGVTRSAAGRAPTDRRRARHRHIPAIAQKRWPRWQHALRGVQRASSIAALGLLGTTLALYAGVMQTQTSWNQRFERLQALQSQAHTLAALNATLEQQWARQARQSQQGWQPVSRQAIVPLEPAAGPAFRSRASPTLPPERPADPRPGGY